MTFEDVCKLVADLPGVERSTSYGTPSLKVKGKFLTRIREDGESLVVTGVGFDEREMLMEADPEVFYITPHYRDWPAVLMRLSKVEPGTVRGFLERRWREVAPKTLVKQYDAKA